MLALFPKYHILVLHAFAFTCAISVAMALPWILLEIAMKKKLTPRFIQSLAPAFADSPPLDIMDDMVPGFGVRVMGKPEAPVRSFILRARFPRTPSKQPSRVTIGTFAKLDGTPSGKLASEEALRAARQKARKWLDQIEQGRDPRDEEERERQKQLQKLKNTFGGIVEDFIAKKLPGERRGSDVEADIRREFVPVWGARPVADITEREIKRIITGKAKTAPAQARALLGHAKRIFEWAKNQDEYGLEVNPAASLKPTVIIGKKIPRNHRLADDELFAFWRAASRTPYPASPVYQLLLLTGLRLNEVAEARWEEFPKAVVRALRAHGDKPIDWSRFERRQLLWIIPASRMKGRDDTAREHAVPLTPDMLAILERLPHFDDGDCLFSHTNGKTPAIMSTDKKDAIDRRMLQTLRAIARKHGEAPDAVKLKPWRNHDLRRNVRSGLSSLPGVREEVREAVLAHARPGISGTYDVHDYLDEKREALLQWGALLRTIVEPSPTASNVVSLRA
jgi:integrase